MLDLCVYSLDGVESDDADRFLYLNRELLNLWEQNGRAAFSMPEWQEADAEVEALRGLIPADERRHLVEQVGVGFFCQPGFGEFQETAVYMTSDDQPYPHRTRVCAGCGTAVYEDDLADDNLCHICIKS